MWARKSPTCDNCHFMLALPAHAVSANAWRSRQDCTYLSTQQQTVLRPVHASSANQRRCAAVDKARECSSHTVHTALNFFHTLQALRKQNIWEQSAGRTYKDFRPGKQNGFMASAHVCGMHDSLLMRCEQLVEGLDARLTAVPRRASEHAWLRSFPMACWKVHLKQTSASLEVCLQSLPNRHSAIRSDLWRVASTKRFLIVTVADVRWSLSLTNRLSSSPQLHCSLLLVSVLLLLACQFRPVSAPRLKLVEGKEKVMHVTLAVKTRTPGKWTLSARRRFLTPASTGGCLDHLQAGQGCAACAHISQAKLSQPSGV